MDESPNERHLLKEAAKGVLACALVAARRTAPGFAKPSPEG
jgi:hypothetical protein